MSDSSSSTLSIGSERRRKRRGKERERQKKELTIVGIRGRGEKFGVDVVSVGERSSAFLDGVEPCQEDFGKGRDFEWTSFCLKD